MQLSKVEFFCDERKTGSVLRMLMETGCVVGKPEVTPVVNAAIKNGRVGAEANGAAAPDLFIKYLHKKKIQEATTQVAKDFLKTIGKSESSYSYLLRVSKERGYLTATNKVR